MTTGLLITTAGRAAIIADLGGGADLVLTHVAWGNANGVPYNPNEAQVALVNEKYRAAIASVAVVGGTIVVDAVIPADTDDGSGRPSHGFNVAEVGLFSSAGTLIGLARCGNGYKPPPSSGQAHDVTYRLKLAVANPSAITVIVEPQAQIAIGRHVRPFWLTIDGVRNDPPAAPDPGATYVVGSAPTGAWTGFPNRLAQWVGVWSLASVPLGHQLVDSSKSLIAGDRWLERTALGWDAGVSRLVQRQPGNRAVAGGSANALTIALDPAPTSWEDLNGVPVRVRITTPNTGTATLNPNGLGERNIRTLAGDPLDKGDLIAGAIMEFVYDEVSDTVLVANLQKGVGPYSIGIINAVTASGLWVRNGQRALLVEGLGGGGAGGGAGDAAANELSQGAGGGAGGYFRKLITNLLASYAMSIGIAGVGVLKGIGGNGGTTSFGSECTATGGFGGNLLSSGTSPNASASGDGGTGTGGDIVGVGQGGQRGVRLGGSNGYGGHGGSSIYGSGGYGRGTNGGGGPASGFGSGGGGALAASANGFAGGNGRPGLINIWEFF